MADHDEESPMMSDESQLNSSDITSQRVGDFEHRLLWNSDESTQVICPTELSYQCGSCRPGAGCMGRVADSLATFLSSISLNY